MRKQRKRAAGKGAGLGESDAELYVMLQYLLGNLEPEEEAIVEAYLERDEIFCQRMAAVELTVAASSQICRDTADPKFAAMILKAA